MSTRGEPVHLTATVKRDGVPVSGAFVSFIIDRPEGVRTIIDTSTNSAGIATASYVLGTSNGYRGLFYARADAIDGTDFVQALTSFEAL